MVTEKWKKCKVETPADRCGFRCPPPPSEWSGKERCVIIKYYANRKEKRETMSKTLTSTPFRQAEHNIDPIYLQRWSPRSFLEKDVPDEVLWSLFEAARWAPSAYNLQPWRFIVARTPEDRAKFHTFISEFNLTWCRKVGPRRQPLPRLRHRGGLGISGAGGRPAGTHHPSDDRVRYGEGPGNAGHSR